jgi:Flp pilus assembly pilin Flp
MLLATFVAMACVVAVTALGAAVSDVFDAIAAELETPGAP